MSRLVVVRSVLISLFIIGGCRKHNEAGGKCVLAVNDSPARGPADAPVTIIEFADFQCPYCGAAVPNLDALMGEYPNDLRLVYKNLPLQMHSRAFPAALAAECAYEQGRFWEMYHLLFANQSHLSDADLVADATAIGLDIGAWNACRADSAALARISADVAMADEARVKGTPTFLINGERIVGAAPLEDFRNAVDNALASANESGIAKSEYYSSLAAQYGCHPTSM